LYDYNVVIVADVLGTFEQAVLLEVLRLGEDAYGGAILKAVLSRSSEMWPQVPFMQYSSGSSVRLALVSPRIGDPVHAGRARRFYRVQPTCIRALDNVMSVRWTV
jgi:hypothetical protein